jgi:hypothetical protein
MYSAPTNGVQTEPEAAAAAFFAYAIGLGKRGRFNSPATLLSESDMLILEREVTVGRPAYSKG